MVQHIAAPRTIFLSRTHCFKMIRKIETKTFYCWMAYANKACPLYTAVCFFSALYFLSLVLSHQTFKTQDSNLSSNYRPVYCYFRMYDLSSSNLVLEKKLDNSLYVSIKGKSQVPSAMCVNGSC